MKRKSAGRSTAVYDFDEGDAEPYITKIAKRKRFYEAFSKGRHFSRSRCKDETDDCQDVTGRLAQTLCFESSHTKERNGNQSSASDAIESDNSDSESSQRRKALDTRFGGARVSSGMLKDEEGSLECSNLDRAQVCNDLDTGASEEIVMNGEELRLSHGKYSLPEFIFTADAVEFKTEDFGFVRLPLSTITNFRSGADEKDLPFVEFDLTENGVQLLRQCLGPSDNCPLSDTIISTFSDSVDLIEKIKQITALSDGYKLIWRPYTEYVRPKKTQCTLQGSREAFDNVEREHVLGDCSLHRSRLRLNDWHDLIYPTQDDRDAVTVTKYDYSLLDPDQFLSDTIIDFYIKYLQRHIPGANKDRFYFYNSFFFRKLTEATKSSKSIFERVKRWTAGTNIFDKDYLFIPIMQNAHWSLVIICHPKYLTAGCSDASDFKAPMILHFDSLEGCHTCIEEPIRSYLMEAWRENTHENDSESLATLKFVALKVPQQNNYSDCGLFLLHYVELFIQEVLEKMFFEPELEKYPFHQWFDPTDASRKRSHIQALIEDLRPKQSVEEHSEPQILPDFYALEPLEPVHKSGSLGSGVCNVCKTPENRHGNLSDQACIAICPHQHHYENNTQLSSLVLSGNEDVHLEPHHSSHGGLHCTLDDLSSVPVLQQEAAENPVASLLMPCCPHVEYKSLVPSHDYKSLDDCLEFDTSDINLEEFHAPVREGNDGPQQCVAEVLIDSSTSAPSSPFLNSKMDAQGGVAFCCHYGDVRVFDRPVTSTAKLSMEETSCKQDLHAYPSSSGSSIGKGGSSAEVSNVAIDGSTGVSGDWKDNSIGHPVVWLEGLKVVSIADANSLTQRTTADVNASTQQPVTGGYLEVGMDASCMEGSRLRQVAEVTGAIRIEDRIREREESTSAQSSKKDGFGVSILQLTKETCYVSEAQSDEPHPRSTDIELKSKVVKKLGGSKSPRVSQRTKKSKVDSPARRITRSLAKDKDQGKGS